MSTITGNSADQLLQQQEEEDHFHGSNSLQEQQVPPAKKKRNLPGNPDPSAEVISLSPKTLIATDRFVCEICKKGFQRDQNLQLHRRGHNLPWKLKLRSTTDEQVRKRVYVCPEPSCVHHDPCRALGDLTGIKKHFSRKHGEKKWKCDKCSKKYAVQSDWKAHVKTCGTREYKCDCGVVFSRRDSFITHRAFCDATTEENKATQVVSGNKLLIPASNNTEKATTTNPSPISSNTTSNNHFDNFDIKNPNLLLVPQGVSSPTLASSSSTSSTLFRNHHGQQVLLPASISGAHFSATELLMKASQMGPTMSTNNSSSSMMNMATSTYGHDFSRYNFHLQQQYQSNQISSNNGNMGMYSWMLCDQSNVELMKSLEQSVKGGNSYGNNSNDVNNAKGFVLNGKNAGGGGDTTMVDFMGIERERGGGRGGGGGGGRGGGGSRGESLSENGQQREVHDEQKRQSKKEDEDDDQLANFGWSWD